LNGKTPEAIVIRTTNEPSKNQENIHILIHILRLRRFSFAKRNSTFIDLPSVDKEKDEGNFSSQSFWNVTDVNQLNQDARLCYNNRIDFVDPSIQDGTYLLNIQIASFENDAVQVSLFCMPLLI
jgi:hypothetical protein